MTDDASRAAEAAPKIEYPELDPRLLEPYFCRHMNAMTAERLDSKSDIAIQLARRDQIIDALKLALKNEQRTRDAIPQKETDRG